MSGHLELEMLKKLQPMINSVVVKPFNMATLLTRLGDLLSAPSAESDGGEAEAQKAA